MKRSQKLSLIICLLFAAVIFPGIIQSQTLKENPALDAKVKKFLSDQSGKWYDLNIPVADGKTLYDLIIKGNYKSALEIGTSTGHSGIYIAWALSKTGGKLITIDIDEERHKTALENFKKAGLSEYIDARLADAHTLVKELNGPFDFVFSDADKDWYKNYFVDVDPKLKIGGCFTTHNISERNGRVGMGLGAYLEYVRSLKNYESTLNSEGSGLLISYKRATTVSSQGPQNPNVYNIKRKWLDLAYDEKSQAQKLDIYLPNEGEGPFPVIISIHGGAFKSGDKADGQVTPMLEGLKRGYAVVSINYRLSGEAIWPAQIYDCKAAVRWVRANAKQYKLNPDKIAAWGGSAGGHLSAMLGTSGNVKELEDLTQGNADQSSRVQAVVDWFGPTNFLKMDDDAKESKVNNPQIHSIPNSPESELIGKNLTDAPELVRAANPETYITKDDPPFLIQHGSVDPLVPYPQSRHFAEKLERITGKENVTFELISGASHGGPAFSTSENLNKVFVFLDKTLNVNKK